MLQDPSPILIEMEWKRGQNILSVGRDFIGRKWERHQNINMVVQDYKNKCYSHLKCTFLCARFKKDLLPLLVFSQKEKETVR